MSALTPTNAQISVQDQAGAVQNVSDGNSVYVTPGTKATVALQSTSGVSRWELTVKAPNYPAIDNLQYVWTPGMFNGFAIPFPAQPVGQPNVFQGVRLVSVVSDGVSSLAQATSFVQSRGNASVPMQHFARVAIAAALAAYTNTNGTITANANGAIGAQDGITLAVGDIVLLPDGLAAAGVDAGLYQVQAVGGASAKFILTSSPDWPQGGIAFPKTEILVSEGTLYGGTTWVVTKTGLTNAIGTASFTFVPREVIQSITLVAGTATITNVPISSATKTIATAERTTANTCAATTGGYHTVGGKTIGALGTASLVFDATVAAGTINNADVSTLAVSIRNPV